jgi:hypothetical protein
MLDGGGVALAAFGFRQGKEADDQALADYPSTKVETK